MYLKIYGKEPSPEIYSYLEIFYKSIKMAKQVIESVKSEQGTDSS
jgi:hypothetical protein